MPQSWYGMLPAAKYWVISADPTYAWPWMKLRGPPANGIPDANWPWAIYPGPPAAPYPPVPATNPGRLPFGTFPAMKTHMREDLKSWPPYGVIKLKFLVSNKNQKLGIRSVS
jgi:hypothetical protein